MELKIAQIQMPVTADKEANIRRACDMVRQAGDIDMAVLPEMFCCPYDNACFRPYGEAEGGPAYRALSALARERGICLLATPHTMFTACGILYKAGLVGGA